MAAPQSFTNLTGLLIVKNPKPVLLRIYKRISALLEKMPESSKYRQHTQEVINYRTSVINSVSIDMESRQSDPDIQKSLASESINLKNLAQTEDTKVMEQKINCGQIEEVIQQARAELEVAQSFIVSRPWEELVAPIPKNQWKWPVK